MGGLAGPGRAGKVRPMADQRVVVLDYDPEWPARFADQRPPVEELLGPWLFDRFTDHPTVSTRPEL